MDANLKNSPATLTFRGKASIRFAPMPTYEYVCDKCGHAFEFFQSMTAKPLTTCPKEICPKKRWGKGKVSKQLSAGAGLIFKGTGFYITDYRSQNYKEGAKKDSSASSTPSSSDKSSGSAASSGASSSAAPSKTKSEKKK